MSTSCKFDNPVNPDSDFFVFSGCFVGQKIAMKKYVCNECGYIYDPEEGDPDAGIEPGTAFSDLPPDWVCPVCGASKDKFTVEE